MTEPAQSVTVFGIPVKPVLFLTIIVGIVLTDIDYHHITDTFEKSPVTRQHGTEQDQSDTIVPQDIVATPEMIDQARRKIEAGRRDEREKAFRPAAADRWYYIVELHSGGDLEATNLTIRPDRIILTSASGIETVIDRRSVRKIHRIKLPPEDS